MYPKLVLGALALAALCLHLEGAHVARHEKTGKVQHSSARSIRVQLSRPSQNPPGNSARDHWLASKQSAAVGEPIPVNLYNYYGFEYDYFGVIVFGGALQPFGVVFDTDSSDVWLPSSDCTSQDCATLAHRFDPSTSFTYASKNTSCKIEFGSTSGAGRLGQDLLQVANLMIWNQTFCEATELSIGNNLGQLYDGVVGLSVEGSEGLLHNMLRQKLIDEPLFTFYLNRDPNVWPCGELNFGSIQENLYWGELTYAPLTKPDRWQVKVDGLNIGEQYVHGQSFEAVIATRSPYVSGPRRAIEAINELLGFKPLYKEFFGSLDCDLPHTSGVTFSLAGQNFTLNADQYATRFDTSPTCLSIFKIESDLDDESGVERPWTFGSPLLGEIFMVFDQGNKRVGFAHPNRNFTSSTAIAMPDEHVE